MTIRRNETEVFGWVKIISAFFKYITERLAGSYTNKYFLLSALYSPRNFILLSSHSGTHTSSPRPKCLPWEVWEPFDSNKCYTNDEEFLSHLETPFHVSSTADKGLPNEPTAFCFLHHIDFSSRMPFLPRM